jgi:hypothetical protein
MFLTYTFLDTTFHKTLQVKPCETGKPTVCTNHLVLQVCNPSLVRDSLYWVSFLGLQVVGGIKDIVVKAFY